MTTEGVEKKDLLVFLEKLSVASKGGKDGGLYARVRELASRSRRRRIAVNLDKIDRCTKDNENVIVPGKVLGGGRMTKKIGVCAAEYSAEALEKLKSSGCKILTIDAAIENGKARLIA